MACVLHVDDDGTLRSLVRAILESRGHTVTSAVDGRDGLARLHDDAFDLVVSDIQMPVMDGLDLLKAIMRERPETPVVMATSVDTIKTALYALKVGAFDYVLKPFKVPVLLDTIERALAWDSMRAKGIPSSARIGEFFGLPDVIAVSPAMRGACDMIRRVAPLRTAHLITGEAGTGRGLAARAIHRLGPRREAPFVRVPCRAPADGGSAVRLLAADMVASAPAGPLLDAGGGTLVLEDIECLPLDQQDLLLGAMNDGVVQPASTGRPLPVNVRVLATTATDLRAAVEGGTLREELFRCLTLLPVLIAPLRERCEDIVPLAWFFLSHGDPPLARIPELARDARAALEHYRWPGNVSELREAILFAAGRCAQGVIAIADLPPAIEQDLEGVSYGQGPPAETERGRAFRERLAENLAKQTRDRAVAAASPVLPRPSTRVQVQRPADPVDLMADGAYVLPDPVATAKPGAGPAPAAGAPAANRPPGRVRPVAPPAGRTHVRRPGWGARLRKALSILFGRE